MELDTVQCPKCGAPININKTQESACCSYCGSKLHLKIGQSGYIMETIKDDTNLLAKQAAYTHLQQELAMMETSFSQLNQQWTSENSLKGVGCIALLIVSALILGIIILSKLASSQAVSGLTFTAFIISILIVIFSITSNSDRSKKAKDMKIQLDQLTTQINDTRKHVQRLESELSELSRNV